MKKTIDLKRLRRERDTAIIEAVRAGESAQSLAERYGLSLGYIRQMAYAAGLSFRTAECRLRDNTLRVVAELREGDDAVLTIAERHGLTRQRVGQIKLAAIAAGFQIPPRKR